MPAPKLFLSYNSADRASVMAIQKLLEARGITTFLDHDNLLPGLPWPQALEQALSNVDAVAVFIGRELGGWQKREMWSALDRQVKEEKQGRAFPVIPALLRGADLNAGFLFTNTWIDLSAGLDQALDAFERSINRTGSAARAAERRPSICPYRGLQIFREEDAAFFAGRTTFSDQLLEFTRSKDFVAIVGPSGSGKSSLVQAGLVPRLRRERPPATTWDVVTFTPSKNPFHRLASALIPFLEPEMNEVQRLVLADELGANLGKDKTKLESIINRVLEKSNCAGRLLVVADQFEELFTLTPEPDRRQFAQALLSAIGSAPFTLLVTLRADFYSQIIDLDRRLSDRLSPAQVNIGALTREELQESITVPAKFVGLEFEPGLAERILADVGSEPGRLPLVEFALTELWQRRKGTMLTNEAYDEIGGVAGALAQRAEAEFARLSPEEQAAARRLFSRLVRVARPEEAGEDTRQRADLEIGDSPARRVATSLADARLLVTGGSDEERLSVEIAHEALIRNWHRLRFWLNEDREFLLWRQRLQPQVEDWQEHTLDSGYLLRSSPLSEAQNWLEARPHDLTATEQQLIRESTELREREREQEEHRRQEEIDNARRLQEAAEGRAQAERHRAEDARRSARRLRWLVLALGSLFAMAGVVTWFAYRQTLTAQSLALAAQAEEMRGRDQPDALSRAIQAWSRKHTDEAHHAIASSFSPGITFLRADPGFPNSAVFSPDGQWVLSASSNIARVWNAISGQALAPLRGHTDSVRKAEFSPDGRRIVTASFDRTARVWNAISGELLVTLEGHTDRLSGAVFSPDGQCVLTASDDHTARLWNAQNGQLLVALQGHTGVVLSAAFSPDGQRIVTSSADKTARIWNAVSGQLLATLQGHTGPVISAAFSPDGQRVLTASTDKTARLWNARSGQLLNTLQGHNSVLMSAVFSPDGQRVLTASGDSTARVWNAENGKQLLILQGHSETVRTAVFSPSSQRILTAGVDGTARVWNGENGQLLAILRSHSGSAISASFSPEGQRILIAEVNGTLQVSSDESLQLVATLRGRTGVARTAVFSPDGHRILSAGSNQTAWVWNAESGQTLVSLQGHTGLVVSAVFSPDGQRVLTASDDHTARVWNAETGQPLVTLQGHTGPVVSAVFSPDGQRILTASDDHTARIWNAFTGQLLGTLQGHTGVVRSALFSPNGRQILTASDDHTARLWDAVSGRLLVILRGHTWAVMSALFSPDGQRVLTASDDYTARLWDARNGQPLVTLQGHTGPVVSAVFSQDGQHILTASQDHTARVWDAGSGQLLATLAGLEGFTDPVRSAVFSPDGKHIITTFANSPPWVWSIGLTAGWSIGLAADLSGTRALATSAVFSPDGQLIVTTSDFGPARVLRLVTLSQIADLLAK